MAEFMEASALIQEKAHDDANIIIGALFDETLDDELRVTVIATGISAMEETETIAHLDVARNKNRPEQQPPKKLAIKEEDAAAKARTMSNAQPNPLPQSPVLPTPVFDDREHENWDEPAYIRKKAN